MTVSRSSPLSLHRTRGLFAALRKAAGPGRLIDRLRRFRAEASEREVARLVDRDAPKGPQGRGGRHFV